MPEALLPCHGLLNLLAFLGGFTAAEGHFALSGDRFAFHVAVAEDDTEMCTLLRVSLGTGSVWHVKRRHERHTDVAVYGVQSISDLVAVVVPFMDEFLPDSHKRQQYLVWREQLLAYWERDARRVRACTIAGCERRRRAKGLCRGHYFKLYRR